MCRRYLKIYEDTLIQENSIEVYTWSTAHVRNKYPLLHRFTTLYCSTETSRTAKHIFCTGILQAPQVVYANRTTASSCLSARKPATYHETTQSPTAPHSTLLLPDDASRSHRPSIKHVQFPDDTAHSNQASAGSLSPTSNAGVLTLRDTAAA
jgi:hypothetical protein